MDERINGDRAGHVNNRYCSRTSRALRGFQFNLEPALSDDSDQMLTLKDRIMIRRTKAVESGRIPETLIARSQILLEYAIVG
jgi:hypothetical protein